jgi:hypothetical protein
MPAIEPTQTFDRAQALIDDSNKPPFSGVVAGIILHSGIGSDVGAETACPEAFQFGQSIELARGTPFQIEPTYSPPNVPYAYSEASATLCQGKLVGAGRFWAPISVQRTLRPEPWNYSHGPADRISACSVSGRPAVCVRPVLPDGRGGAVVTFATETPDGFVVTQVQGEIPLSDAIKIAESLRP